MQFVNTSGDRRPTSNMRHQSSLINEIIKQIILKETINEIINELINKIKSV